MTKPKTPKLTESDVKEIKKLLQQKELTAKEIGKLFNINKSTVYGIKYEDVGNM